MKRQPIVSIVMALCAMGLGLAGLAPARASAAPDTLPPDTPGGFRITGRSAGSLNLYWDWTADKGGGYVDRWELSYPGTTVLISHNYPGHTQSIANLNQQPGLSYVFELRAVDTAGNRSAQPARLVFETTPPGAATNLQITSTRAGYPDMLSFTGAPDNAGPPRLYEIFLNGESLGQRTAFQNTISLFEQVFLIACIDPPSGPATVELRAVDTSFNSGQRSAPLTVQFP